MKHEKTYRRKDGTRIKLTCDVSFHVEVYKAEKGKRFARVAPIWLLRPGENGLRFNGAYLLDANNRTVVWDGKMVDDKTVADYSINLYATPEEVHEVKIGMWEKLKPVAP